MFWQLGGVSDPWTPAGIAIAALVCVAAPVLAGLWWHRRSGAPLSAFGAGVLVFLVSQIVLRLPWQILLGRWVVGHPQWRLSFLLFSAFTAALFEETGRWLGYRYLIRERSRRVGVMFGLGHGALESILLVGMPLTGLLVGWYLVPHQSLPADALRVLEQQVARISFWNVQLAALERASAVVLHVGLALIVLQAWTREGSGARWLGLAMLLHFAVNGLAVVLIQEVRLNPLLGETIIALMAVAVLWFGWRLASEYTDAP